MGACLIAAFPGLGSSLSWGIVRGRAPGKETGA